MAFIPKTHGTGRSDEEQCWVEALSSGAPDVERLRELLDHSPGLLYSGGSGITPHAIWFIQTPYPWHLPAQSIATIELLAEKGLDFLTSHSQNYRPADWSIKTATPQVAAAAVLATIAQLHEKQDEIYTIPAERMLKGFGSVHKQYKQKALEQIIAVHAEVVKQLQDPQTPLQTAAANALLGDDRGNYWKTALDTEGLQAIVDERPARREQALPAETPDDYTYSQ